MNLWCILQNKQTNFTSSASLSSLFTLHRLVICSFHMLYMLYLAYTHSSYLVLHAADTITVHAVCKSQCCMKHIHIANASNIPKSVLGVTYLYNYCMQHIRTSTACRMYTQHCMQHVHTATACSMCTQPMHAAYTQS